MTDQNAPVGMSPDDSPDDVGKKSGVRRVNNVPMFLLFGAVGIFILIMVIVAGDRAAKQHQQQAATAKTNGGDSDMFAKQVAGGNTSGVIPAKKPTMPALSDTTNPAAGTGNSVQVAHPNLDAPPSPPNAPTNTQQDNERDRMQQAKLNEFEDAIHAKTAVQAQGFRSPGSAPGGADSSSQSAGDANARMEAVNQSIAAQRSTDPTAAFKAQLAMIKASGILPAPGGGGGGGSPQLGGGMGGAGGAGGSAGKTSANNDVSRFAGNDAKGDRWALGQEPTAPTTAYEIRAGAVMPATLISGINSELPGQIMAQVAQNVYDTATGRYLLIPQGSRLVGTYASEVAYGQSRVLVAWQRIVFPDGKALDIGAMPGADPEGYAGFHDKVNNHYFRIFGSALLMSGVTAGIAYSQNQNNNSATGYGQQQSASSALSEATGQQLGMATAQMIEKNLNIAPTLEIRPGFRFNVIATKDITLTKPYQSFDY